MATTLSQYVNTNSSANQNTSSASNTAQNQQNTFNSGQLNLQSLLPMLYSQLAGGQIPTSFTNPQALNQQFQQNFNNTVAPQLSAEYGPGSPQIASQEAQGEVNLAGNEYNTGVSNFLNTLAGASSNALTPLGASTTGANQSVGNTNQVASLTSLLTQLGFNIQ